ncbi:MAG: hypothetical protein C0501_30365 [Isosphaera sp.]|nr:hypothetical protein [Isosphaera sp.]
MFGLLKKLFRRPAPGPFAFFDGAGWRTIDPTPVSARVSVLFNPAFKARLADLAAGDDADRAIAMHEAAELVRRAFDLPAFEDLGGGRRRGLTAAELVRLMDDFAAFARRHKKR